MKNSILVAIALLAAAQTAADELTVYEQPVESPVHAVPLPPADARTVVVDPQLAAPDASPLGWFDDGTTQYSITRGNNVHAYDDRNADNLPPPVEVDCGPLLECNFPLDLTADPADSVPASVTNFFYWANLVHDVQYRYGFDEQAGNFQVSNFGRGGLGGDDLRAEAQEGAFTCSANFATPPDGQRPVIQIAVCGLASPARDGSLDAGVIVHEYGHGISLRQVGGPANTSCLQNVQQPGEGLSDWWALAYTAEAGDTGPDPRTIGNYLFGQDAGGPGIRTFPFSTDLAVNPDVYSVIAGKSVPHGVGETWAAIAWQAYWKLVDLHGFDPDLYDATGDGGNQRMMLYVNEAMQNVVCSPTFLDFRAAILAAAIAAGHLEDLCPLWRGFAERGLGIAATTEGPNSLNATDGFEPPRFCQTVPCASVRGIQARCVGGTLRARVRFDEANLEGVIVTLAVDDELHGLRIRNSRADFEQAGLTGQHQLTLVDPAGCGVEAVVDCGP